MSMEDLGLIEQYIADDVTSDPRRRMVPPFHQRVSLRLAHIDAVNSGVVPESVLDAYLK